MTTISYHDAAIEGTTPRRRALLRAIEFVGEDRGFHDTGGLDELEQFAVMPGEIDRYLLVEQGRDGAWLSLCESPENAADTHVGQECREDWEPLGVVDLDTGEWREPVLTLTWTENPTMQIFPSSPPCTEWSITGNPGSPPAKDP